jgi:hypothetical protein
MAYTLIYDGNASEPVSAERRDGDLVLSLDDLAPATGWESKPQGLCRGERCVPVPPARRAEFFAPDDRFNLSAFARYLEQPAVHDDAASVWLFGESAGARGQALRSLQAPDFRLPDLAGKEHALSDYLGKKVLLLTWASW